MLTDVEKSCIWTACDEYKRMVSQPGPDALPGLLDKWSVSDFYNAVIDNADEFKKNVIEHPFFNDKGYKSLADAYEREKSLFLYCLQSFLSNKLLGSLVSTSPIGETIEVNPETMEPITADEPNDDRENKKNFVKEVLDGVPKKKYLKEFLTDPRSYKQWRDDVDRCLLYIDWEKIHRVMKKLKWKWFSWVDEEYNEHTNTTPSAFGLREHVKDTIAKIEEWVMNHPEEEEYRGGTGGFEYEMYVCDPNVEVDDYDNRVRFAVRFVLEEFDNAM